MLPREIIEWFTFVLNLSFFRSWNHLQLNRKHILTFIIHISHGTKRKGIHTRLVTVGLPNDHFCQIMFDILQDRAHKCNVSIGINIFAVFSLSFIDEIQFQPSSLYKLWMACPKILHKMWMIQCKDLTGSSMKILYVNAEGLEGRNDMGSLMCDITLLFVLYTACSCWMWQRKKFMVLHEISVFKC